MLSHCSKQYVNQSARNELGHQPNCLSICSVSSSQSSFFLLQIVSHDDPDQLPDPFNDISIGGWEITDEPLGRLSVWAVSLQGRVCACSLSFVMFYY